MVNETAINSSAFLVDFWKFMPNPVLDGIGFIVNLAKIAGVLVIIYLIFLIVRALFRARAINNIRTIMQNIVDINHKLDRLILILEKKHSGSEKDKGIKREEVKGKKPNNKKRWNIFKR